MLNINYMYEQQSFNDQDTSIHWEPTEWLGPFNPYLIETWPDNKFTKEEGIKKGDIRLGPFSYKSIDPLYIVSNPPMPEPIITPVLSFDFSYRVRVVLHLDVMILDNL